MEWNNLKMTTIAKFYSNDPENVCQFWQNELNNAFYAT